MKLNEVERAMARGDGIRNTEMRWFMVLEKP